MTNARASGDGIAPIRLNRAISGTGLCSRRKADELIFAGQVKVNGRVIMEPGTRVSDTDLLEVNGKILGAQECKYVLMYKPPEVVSTCSDPQGRTTVLDLLPPELRGLRLYPVGRLDYFSEGLLLLTNDGALAHWLMHPSHGQHKVYEVVVRGEVPRAALVAMASGFVLPVILPDGKRKDIPLAPMGVQAQSLPGGNTLLTLELSQGINRQIRRVCAHWDLVILRLRRVAEGPLTLGDLAVGQVRELSVAEVAALKGEDKGRRNLGRHHS